MLSPGRFVEDAFVSGCRCLIVLFVKSSVGSPKFGIVIVAAGVASPGRSAAGVTYPGGWAAGVACPGGGAVHITTIVRIVVGWEAALSVAPLVAVAVIFFGRCVEAAAEVAADGRMSLA